MATDYLIIKDSVTGIYSQPPATEYREEPIPVDNKPTPQVKPVAKTTATKAKQ